MIEIIKVGNPNIHLLQQLIKNLGSAATSFRYFNSRPLATIKNHLVTLLLLEQGQPAAYGHLDKENDVVWLGICVLPIHQKKGLGNIMMDALVHSAVELNIKEIMLTVDNDNIPAIKLYDRFNFKKIESFKNFSKFKLQLP